MDAGKTELKGMKKNRYLLFAAGTGFLSVFLLMNSCAFSSRASRNLLEESMTKGYDIIVVPGVPFENGQWSSTMKGRIYWSKYLYDMGIARNVMYSGSAVYTPYNEAEIMALYAERIGIPGANILTEKRAEHSTENIYYSYRKARKLGYESIALASDPFQTKMLKAFTRKKVSPDVGFIPIVYDTLRAMEYGMTNPEIDHHKAFESDFVPLPQRENFFERFRGTRGAYIDTSAYR
jgi:uncharacterized SAM-binding protein YcdF (DUF218 family)